MAFELDDATTLAPLGDGRFTRGAGGAWQNADTAFGGWVLALAVEAMRSSEGARGNIVSINAIFPDAIRGEDLLIETDRLQHRPRTDFWRVRIAYAAAPEQTVFSADLIASTPRDGDISHEPIAPISAVAPEDAMLAPSPPGPRWFKHVEQRWAEGVPFRKAETLRSITFARLIDRRPLDEKALIVLTDAIAPRSFFAADRPSFGSTISFAASIFATEDDYAEVGTDYVMIEGDGDVVRRGVNDQRGRLFTRSGRLLATTYQTAFHK